MKKTFLALMLVVGCGKSVCDESAERYCRRLLNCRIDTTEEFDRCLTSQKKRFAAFAATDAMCSDAAALAEQTACCDIAKTHDYPLSSH